MSSERLWGQRMWIWWALAVSAAASVALLLLSLTVSGRIFSVMLLISEAFIALSLFMGWARSERMRFEVELATDDGDRPLS